jgi:hypothetical protein
MLIKTSIGGFLNRVYKTRGGSIIIPNFDAFLPRHRNVLAVLTSQSGKLLIPASNIVTDDGDVYYAERGAGGIPSNAFGIHELCTAGTPGKQADRDNFTPISGTQKAHTATYPKTADADTDNTGAGIDIVTYLATYAKSDFANAAVSHGIITNSSPNVSPSEEILTGYAFTTPFAKTLDDSLKVFVNHEMRGV